MDATDIITILFAILIKWSVGLFPYSGYNKPPIYGDYEAQRHWMEITVNLKPEEWYRNSTKNDLLYWGLDYPPLTAYHSYLMGSIAKIINPDWIQLFQSRGYESHHHQLFMRSTVLLSDLIIYLPALYLFWKMINEKSFLGSTYFLRTLLVPSLILIDYGHFQYNCITLGFLIWTVILIEKDYDLAASFMFCLALNYKQMALYYSLPVFFILLKRCWTQKSSFRKLFKLLSLSSIVLFIFGLLWLPYLTDLDSTLQVVRRIFPLNRGIYEDKVANFWYCISIVFKVKNYFNHTQLAYISAFLTVLFTLPVCLTLFHQSSTKMFKYSLVNVSLSFFLFSFQVHEKTILFVEIPLLLLSDIHPFVSFWFSLISTFSLQPLLIKDDLTIPYFSVSIIFIVICQNTLRYNKRDINILFATSIFICAMLSISSLTISPPDRFPHLHVLLNCLYSFVHFVLFFIFFLYKQLMLYKELCHENSQMTHIRQKIKSN